MANLGRALTELRKEKSNAQRDLRRLDDAISAIVKLSGRNSAGSPARNRPRRHLSAAARRRIAAAQRARWAKVRQEKKAA